MAGSRRTGVRLLRVLIPALLLLEAAAPCQGWGCALAHSTVAVRSPAPPEIRALGRAPHHYQNWYFVALDGTRVDLTSPESIRNAADDIAAAASAERLAGEFLRVPQGFQVAASAEAVQRILRDVRVKSVEEVGDYVRATEPIAGSYLIEFDVAHFGGKRVDPEDVRRLAEQIVTTYGGRVTFVRESILTGFTAEDMTEGSARALSQDPRIKAVYENGLIRLQPSQPTIVVPRSQER
jgi:hypothetical protein